MKNQYPSLNVTAIEDIGLIYVENSKNIDVNKIENKIIEYIDIQGELPDLISPYEDTVTPNRILNEVKQLTLDEFKESNQFD
ncbi:hypothetical protein J2S13_003223 [Oikeobacillus pervagus]|uniref:Uncharacterized protein n=1 Tax=Oikeobacillus pervagus TaxID=1325931 RepID=A0AAJ1T121_9BACI|nr:hypothetical protein [Oikeobacillus pervagus]MDQ0216739.1 hypothetical protein [Oikeobacillus pervagus]